MNTLIIIVYLTLLVSIVCNNCQASEPLNYFSPIRKVVGGSSASEEQFPSLASLLISGRTRDYYVCSASIISSQWVLTAAHCLQESYANNKKYLVGVSSASVQKSKKYEVVKYVKHPLYEASNLDNDIAVLKLEVPLEMNAKVKAIALLETDTLGNCTGIGWGATGRYSQASDLLLHHNAFTISNSDCEKHYAISSGHICSMSNEGEDTCYGDSGSPLICNGQQAGVLSFGNPDCNGESPAVYTRVSKYVEWIHSIIN